MKWLARWGGLVLALIGGLAAPGLGQAILAADRDQVNIRADATVQSNRIAVLTRGDEVEELTRHSEWVQVRLPDGRSGWVHSQLVQTRLVVEGQGVRVRSSATSQSASITMLYRGQEIGKIGERGNWYEVRLGDGRTGWAYSRYLRAKTAADVQALIPATPEDVSPAPATVPPAADGEPLVAASVAPSLPADAASPAPAASPPDDEAASGQADAPLVQRNPYVSGLQFEAGGESDRALESFEEVLAAEPENVNALFHAAKAHRQLGQLDQALERLNHALEISGGRKDLYLTLGEVYRLRGVPDSAAKYQALFRGERPPEPARLPETETGDEDEAGSLPKVQLAVAAGLLVFLITLGVWWTRRKAASDSPATAGERRRRSPANARFERTLERESAAAREGGVSPEEERELDRQIEDKWRELRESADLFASPQTQAAGEAEGEEENLNRLLDQVEVLRRGMDLQDERSRLYADIVRLQNMKIESMREELRLRGRR